MMNKSHMLHNPVIFAITALLLVGISSRASAVDFSVGAGLAEIYTSNLFLAPSGSEEDKFITEIAPFVELTNDGERLEYEVDYKFQMLLYPGDSDLNNAYSDLSSLAFINLIGDELRLRGLARVTQVNIDPAKKVTGNNFNITGNRSDAIRWEGGPDWNQELGAWSEIDAYYYAGQIKYDGTNASDVDTQRGRFEMGSKADSESTLAYRLVYDYYNYDYVSIQDVKRQGAYLRLDYDIANEFQIFGLAGLDSDLADRTNGFLTENRWEAGIVAAGTTSRLEASVGNRYFGNTYRFEFERVGESSLFRVLYREEPGSAESIFVGSKPRPTGVSQDTEPLDQPVLTGLDSLGSGKTFVSKRAETSLRLSQFRSSTIFRIWWEQRDFFSATAGPANNGQKEKTIGAAFKFNWDLGESTLAHMDADWRIRRFPRSAVDPNTGVSSLVNRDDTLWQINAGVDYKLGTQTSLTLNVGFENRDQESDSGGLVATNIEYDQLYAAIRLSRYF